MAHLDPQRAAFAAMVDGWSVQQRSRNLKSKTIAPRLALVRRLVEFSNQYPWQWSAGEVEAFLASLRSGAGPVAVSTLRNYEVCLRLFLDYVTDARYGWPSACLERFGAAPVQLLHEWNSVAHVAEYEGDARRRPLSYDEVQALFDAADASVEQIRARGRKGALAAQRDAALLKVIYAFGLRRGEACGLDIQDLRHNPKARQFGRFGALMVRHGKASRGGAPKRRTVLTVPEMDWVVGVLEQWMDELRPLFNAGKHAAMWVTERRGRMSRRAVNDAFAQAREAAGLDEYLDLHCLRHSYVTHLVEFDYPQRFVQEQVGHRHASTTAIYTGVSDEYRNRLVQRSLGQRFADLGVGQR
ncbi:tyrosine-type recombinase/integrase [Micromonospora sp. NPDC006766]|uniref:tyrosine-type recombinase/integrase n=1 Tax=Micromonospora sp. NPDC006766 TaxID=3154778 RepID=UPI0034070172